MTDNRSGRNAESQPPADESGTTPSGQGGNEQAGAQPPNPEPAEGPRDPEYTDDTYPQTDAEQQETSE